MTPGLSYLTYIKISISVLQTRGKKVCESKRLVTYKTVAMVTMPHMITECHLQNENSFDPFLL